MFNFLLKYDQIEEAQRKTAGLDGMLSKSDTILKSLYVKLLFGNRTLKKHLETVFEGKKESALVNKAGHKLTLKQLVPLYLKSAC